MAVKIYDASGSWTFHKNKNDYESLKIGEPTYRF